MEKFLRDWRQDALNKHQYDSAIFIGDKLLALTRMLSDFPCNSLYSSTYVCVNTDPICFQKTTKMPSGWPKSTSPLATTLAPKASSPSKILSHEIHLVDIWPDTV
jgi:hypothetical protein